MKRLWVLLINGLSALVVATAFPHAQHNLSGDLSAIPPSSISFTTNATPIKTLPAIVNDTCQSPDGQCDWTVNIKHYNNHVLSNINDKANPCEDFHAYACGGAKIRETVQKSVMDTANERVNDKFVHLFSHLLGEKGHSNGQALSLDTLADAEAVYGKLLRYYTICKTATTVKDNWSGYLEGVLEQIKIQHHLEHRSHHHQQHYQHQHQHQHLQIQHQHHHHQQNLMQYSWLDIFTEISRYGENPFFYRLRVLRKNITFVHIQIEPAHDGRYAAFNYTNDIHAILQPYTHLGYVLLRDEFIDLESKLREIARNACAGHELDEEGDCDLAQTLTLAELELSIPDLNWRHYLGTLLGHALYESHILIEDVVTIRKTIDFLNGYDAHIVHLFTLANFMKYMQSLRYNAVKSGASPSLCIQHIRKLFHSPMTYLYERAFYAPQRPTSESIIRSVFKQLKDEFESTLQKNKMNIDANILEYLKRKLQRMSINVGNLPTGVDVQFYANYMRDFNVSHANSNTKVDEYESHELTGNNHITLFHRNHLEALKHGYIKYRSLGSVNDASPWHTSSYHKPDFPDNIDSTAYFSSMSNMIILPHAYLQPPFFDKNFSPVFIYGDLANTLGHELLHAFETSFLDNDAYGNYEEKYYKALKTNENFNNNLDCLSRNLQPKWLNERIADVSGTRLALNTFLRTPRDLLNNGQVFFLQFAQFFCGTEDDETHLANDPEHEPYNLRLNYTLANIPEFATIFGCPKGSAMNREQRCELW